MDHYGWDIYYLHWHWPDTLNHHTLHVIDPAAPHHDPALAADYMDVVRRSYVIMDEMVGAFMGMADEDTYLVVTSDHGCTPDVWIADVARLLVERGLCALRSDLAGGATLDMSRTQALPIGALQIAVNLEGRAADGVVKPGDFEKVQEEIIDTLHAWRGPDGKRVIALAVKKKDAQFLGYWGERTGDVVFVYNDGFSWRDPSNAAHNAAFEAEPGATVVVAPPHSAGHGPNLPTSRTGMTSNMAAFFLQGPGIKAGYTRDPEKRGFVRLLDVVPTLCHLLGFPPPRQCEGAVLWDYLELGA
jgi:predicted AlkP superfamily phosphohydrolase/phosphomutase